MAQTDARAGFRLPWSSDRPSTDPTDGDPNDETQANATTAWPADEAATPVAPAGAPSSDAEATSPTQTDPWADLPGTSGSPASQLPSRKPSKFLADLTKAMQAAAEDARSRALTQLQTDAKAFVQGIHERSSTEAAGLRRAADDDVAAVREWSKAEIARVREETESRITSRKGRLESEIEEHAAIIEREIDSVQKKVAAFEDEMAAFFERLNGEEDPTRFATMAENLPEPPTFDGFAAAPAAVESAPVADAETSEAVVETPEAVVEPADTPDSPAATPAEATIDDVVVEATSDDAEASVEGVAGTAEAHDAPAGAAGSSGDGTHGEAGEGEDGEVDREAAFAAIQAAAEAAASAEVAADAAARAEAVADVAIEIIGNHEDEEADPRFTALGISPDYDAAEAEALEAASGSTEDIPEIDNDALAARLADLAPGKAKAGSGRTSTQLVVVGLVSVASIASFKRHLGRLTGVQSVGVSSGPDGEFVFAVNHAEDLALRELVPSLPSFQARVTGSADGIVHVTAHDPEADA
jgi:hypothetical protein